MARGKHKRYSRRIRQMRRRRRRRAIFIMAGIVLALGTISLILYRSVSRYPKDIICKNVYIGNVNVSGMTKKEAQAALEKQFEKDKAVTVTVKVGEKTFQESLEAYGISGKGMAEAAEKAVNYGKKGSLWSRYWKIRKAEKEKVVLGEAFTIKKKTAEALLDEQAVPLADHAQNATIAKTADGFEIGKEKDGETVDVKSSLKKIEKHLNDNWDHKDFSVKAVLKKEKPSVVAEDLESIQDEMGAFSTDAGGGERIQNLETAAEKLDGIVLAPGEELSVCGELVPFTAENGYVPGASYEGGKVVESYGGGICQVSTTLYNAVLYAELEVVERYPHSMTVGYVKPSRDAAIAEGILDFKFKNNYDTPVYISCGIDASNELFCKIYGRDTREKGRTVEYESETLSTEEAGITYEADAEAPIGSVQNVSGAYAGVEAQLWKIVYQDGEEVSREVINTSSYMKADAVVEVGIMSDDAQASATVQNAIATQDESAIYAAIAQVQQ